MRFKTLVAAAAFLFLPLAACAADTNYTEGVDYRTLTPPLPVDASKGKVQVTEFFWYGCGHCFQLDPVLQSWLKTKPAYIEFVRIPAVFERYKADGSESPWYIHAKTFYAAKALGVGEKIHGPLFDAIHLQNRSLRTEDELARFFEEQGVPAKDFKAAYESFTVDTQVARAMDLSKRSGITGVPALIVDGKYQATPQSNSLTDFLKIVDFLAAKEHRSH